MIKLGDKQKKHFLNYEKDVYVCVAEEEKGLVSFSYLPYVSYNDGNLIFNVENLNSDIKYILNFNMEKELQSINNPDNYFEFIQKMMTMQEKLYNIESLQEFLKEKNMFKDDLIKKVSDIQEIVQNIVDTNETFFKTYVVKEIPTNWRYAMFHESSWSAYERNHDILQMASGKTTFSPKVIGYTEYNINSIYTYNKERTLKIYKTFKNELAKEYGSKTIEKIN